ncbi:MAG: hypothetical protein KDI44_18745 [Thiothrix sp.]|nr:hypothetical protein [Thiothrix sp.]HPQ94975.1 hypothetical protein [Thiolinea sp.]
MEYGKHRLCLLLEENKTEERHDTLPVRNDEPEDESEVWPFEPAICG